MPAYTVQVTKAQRHTLRLVSVQRDTTIKALLTAIVSDGILKLERGLANGKAK